ncbi:hypothetical protein ISR8_1293 [Streptococcus pyogenes]|nr:Hypothetical protein FE90_1655 [Streptococcus pyogenes]ESA57975.1 hypothetical protein HMPREF1239_1113 [Streptococcus pyogenes GA03805]SDV89561.1 hypothetical protein ISR7_0614 [Streptococcus pyogenes]SDV91505.1 hypothetical protein ISR8_1293 [Streptococcus pyogenes]
MILVNTSRAALPFPKNERKNNPIKSAKALDWSLLSLIS